MNDEGRKNRQFVLLRCQHQSHIPEMAKKTGLARYCLSRRRVHKTVVSGMSV